MSKGNLFNEKAGISLAGGQVPDFLLTDVGLESEDSGFPCGTWQRISVMTLTGWGGHGIYQREFQLTGKPEESVERTAGKVAAGAFPTRRDSGPCEI